MDIQITGHVGDQLARLGYDPHRAAAELPVRTSPISDIALLSR